MPVARTIQTSLASGEFDPLLWAREDVSFFYNSARIIENAVPLPQGGVKRREGWRFRALQRGPISEIDLSGATITATNGGTVASATDGNAATLLTTATAIGTTAEYEVIRIDFASATRVSMLDFDGLRVTGLPSGATSATMTVQHSSDGSAWTDAHSLNVGTTAYNRRFAQKPDSDLQNARYTRLILDNPSGADFSTAVVEFNEMRAQVEAGYSNSGTIGSASLHRLTSSIDDEYVIAITAGCADVFTSAGAWAACVPVPHTDAQVSKIKDAPRLDTLILYQEDQPPFQVQRLGSDGDWRGAEVEFERITQFPFEDENVSGGQNEIHFIRFDDMSNGDELLLEYFGEVSDRVTWTNNEATNATNLKAAIEGLDGFDNVTVTADGTGVNANFEIEYNGRWDKRSVPLVVVDILIGTGTATSSRLQLGKPDTDALWSATRGYPTCGTFYQGRHYMGGFRSRRDLIVASRAGALFDFEEDTDPVASSPIVIAPNIDDQVTIQNIYPGRHLQIFTSSAELYIPQEPISIDNIALKVTSRHGSSADVDPVDIQGGTLFVDRNGRAMREYLFTDAQQSYSAEPVSILAGHLMSSPRSLAMRRARDVDEPTLLLIANTGTDRNGDSVPAAMCVIDRAQQVTGFFRVATEGEVLEFEATQGGDAFALVAREVAGGKWAFFEQFDDRFMSDCAVEVAGNGSTVDVSAYPWLEGKVVEVHGDGLPLGSHTVSSGQIDLGTLTYSSFAQVGFRQVPRVVLHPLKGKGGQSPTMQNMRNFRMLLQLERTGAVSVTGHDGGTPRPVPLRNWDSGTYDPTLEESLFTGQKRISGIGRWQKEPTIEITQIDPMPFLLRSVSFDTRF